MVLPVTLEQPIPNSSMHTDPIQCECDAYVTPRIHCAQVYSHHHAPLTQRCSQRGQKEDTYVELENNRTE